jgi:putative hydrolase of the HAD superfamily
MPVTVLLVDFDGVLRRWPSEAPLEAAHGLPAGSLRAAAFDAALLADVVEGRLRDEDWRREAAVRLRRVHPHADVDGAVARWSSGIGEIDHELLRILRHCIPTLPLVLVSNGSTRLREDLARLQIDGSFDAVVNSSEIGVAKPATAFFEHALRQAGAAPAHALFIDDSPGHVAAAAALGIRAHVYAGAAGVRVFLSDNGVYTSG